MTHSSFRIRKALHGYRTMLLVLFLFAAVAGTCQRQVYLPGGSLSCGVIFNAIEHQLGLGAAFDQGVVDTSWRIRMKRGYFPLDTVLTRCLTPKKLTWVIEGSSIWIDRMPSPQHSQAESALVVRVVVMGAKDERLAGVSIWLDRSGRGYITDRNGVAMIREPKSPVTVVVSHTGYRLQLITLKTSGELLVHLQLNDSLLERAVVNGYGAGSRRNYTGDRTFLDSLGDGGYTGGNLSGWLAGRVSGLTSLQTSGMPGAAYDVTLRGKTSILNRKGLLYIIDKVPFEPGSQSISNIPTGSTAGSLSPLSFISMDEIESVEVLKDADATAIYGSRGANGVILITTRRGTPGKCHVDVNIGTGISSVTRRPALLNMRQYTNMRLEALHNDGTLPGEFNAPELVKWDTTRNVDWGKWAIGGQGHIAHAAISLSGGSNTIRYFLGGSGLRETSVFPTSPAHTLLTLNGSFSYQSPKKRLNVEISGIAGKDNNNQFTSDLTRLQYLVPNAPPLKDSYDKPIFQYNGVPVINPLYFIGNTYEAASKNYLVSGSVNYRLPGAFQVRISGGISNVKTDETSQFPVLYQDPAYNPTGSSYWATTGCRSWTAEPQLEYTFRRQGWSLDLLTGASWQGLHNSMSTVSAFDFPSDSLLRRPEKAGLLSRDSGAADYLYKALFARMNINWKNTYILNITGRRDGSNRFTSGKHYGNFGAAGFAWVFSEADFLKKKVPFLSFGKLRTSYGVTGNDFIGIGHRYLDAWAPTSVVSYQDIIDVWSTTALNPDVSWETIRKMEFSVDLGFMDNRQMLTATWYRHRSDNQLLPNSFPLTGSPLQLHNRAAVLENAGWEFNLNSKIIQTKDFGWTMSANVSFPVSKLASFEGLATTPFARDLVVGQSLNSLRGYRYIGVSPLTGLYQFEDRDGDGKITDADRVMVGNPDVTCFGGLENNFRWRRWRLETLLEGRKQIGAGYGMSIYTANPPGSIMSGLFSNQTNDLVDRWRKPGDRASHQMVSAGEGSPESAKAMAQFLGSSGILTDASFIRLKTVCLSYQWPAEALRKMHLQGIKISLQAQNLLTLTPYPGGDPEIQSAVILPPLKMVVAGLQVKF